MIVHQDENSDIENIIPLPQILLMNYNCDVEHEEDFGNGWEWTERDPGSSCGPFIAHPGLLVQPASHTPEGSIRLEYVDCLLSRQTLMPDKGYNNYGVLYNLFLFV